MNTKINKKIVVFIAGAIVCFIMLEFGLRATALLRSYAQDYINSRELGRGGVGYRIVCLGDSMTEFMYPRFLQKELTKRNNDAEFSVLDKGRSKTDSAFVLSMLDECIDRYKPQMIIVMTGYNDKDREMRHDSDGGVPGILEKLKTYNLYVLLKKSIAAKLSFERAVENAKQNNDYDKLMAAGEEYMAEKQYKESGAIFNKAVELDPDNMRAYRKIFELKSQCLKQPDEAIEWLNEQTRIRPRAELFTMLGEAYEHGNKPEDAVRCFEKSAGLAPANAYWPLIRAVNLYRKTGRYDKCRETIQRMKEMLDVFCDKEGVFGALGVQSLENGRHDEAEGYFRETEKIRSFIDNEITKGNYREIASKALSRRIKLVCMQYPMRRIKPLKDMLEGCEGIVFVDNEALFKDALRKGRYEDYFSDQFAGDFGHCTDKGKRMMAEHIADVIVPHISH